MDGSPPTRGCTAYYRDFPKEGEIYTVRDIIPAQGYSGEHTCAVLLHEVLNPDNDPKGRGEHGFSCERFREPTSEEMQNVATAEASHG